MTIQEKFDRLSEHHITITKRQDENSWRLWLDWMWDDDYMWICENKTIEWCLDMTIEFLDSNKYIRWNM